MNGERIPVTVLSGSLGAGKTSTLNHLLENAGDLRIAVLVNDMGEINVDAELLSAGADVVADGGMAELSNGCICCERQDDLESEVARLAAERDFDVLVVEASGISEPEPIARLFLTESRAAAVYDLDTLVTVVDANLFVETFGDRERVERQTAPGDDDRPLSDLLVEQVEVANVILLNKTDLVDESDHDRAAELIGALNPGAEIIRTVHSRVDHDRILETGRFEPEDLGDDVTGTRAHDSETSEYLHHEDDENPANDKHGHSEHEHHHVHDHHGHSKHDHDHDDNDHSHKDHDHRSPEQTYGVTSFTYRRRRPFHPERLWSFVRDLPPSVVRSKGLTWVAGLDDVSLTFSQAGPTATFESVGPWIASLHEIERDLYRDANPSLRWDDDHGDRRTELVFIGQDIPESDIVDRLDSCLVTDDEWSDAPEVDDRYPIEEGASVQMDLR